ncbi:gb [Venturia nashicola]|uniref:endo-polygalacturonase n=1 Tax=Venturia nashicola TaxID=86259 RepID=A0A4Z1NW17_9PEZI|nr:gb [Venturia nashicola]TLD29821.1 gb [Venturia nashicola]
MVNSRNIASLILGFGSLLGSTHPTDGTTSYTKRTKLSYNTAYQFSAVHAAVPASCIADSYDSYKAIVARCPTSVLKDIKVPVGGQIVLSGLKTQTVAFAGKTEFAASPNGRAPTFPLILFSSSTDTRIVGLNGSVIHGHGEDYWDQGGGNKGCLKPKTWRVDGVVDSVIDGITILNPPVHCFAISNSKHVTLKRIKIDASLADKPCAQIPRTIKRVEVGGPAGRSCGHNSDGFGISESSHIKIIKSVVYNQDDCMALNSGSDITFGDNVCSGGHGIGIGSVKSNKIVTGAKIVNCTIRKSENGVRIKTYDDAVSASVSDISFKNITLESIGKFGIVIQQDYRNEGPTGKAGNTVPIKGVKLEDIKGTVTGANGQAIYVNCGKGTCTDWKWQGIDITGGTIKKGGPSGCIAPPSDILSFCKSAKRTKVNKT